MRSNTGFGLNLGSQFGCRENVLTSNTAGTVTGILFVNLGNNACNCSRYVLEFGGGSNGGFESENNVRANSGCGLDLGTDPAYCSDNVVNSNMTGTVVGVGCANGRRGNYCAGAGTVFPDCP